MRYCHIANVSQDHQHQLPLIFLRNNLKSRRLELTQSQARYLTPTLIQPYNVFAELLNNSPTMENLQFLALSRDWTGPMELAQLAEIKNLRSLHLYDYNNQHMFDICSGLLERTFNAFRHHGHLEELLLKKCYMSKQGYKAIANIKTLRHIAITSAMGVDMDQAIRALAVHGKFRTVTLYNTHGFTDESLIDMVEACPHLKMVNVTGSMVLRTRFKTHFYEWLLQNEQQRAKGPFELHVSSNPRQFGGTRIDPNVLQVVTEMKRSHYYRKPQTGDSNLFEKERAHLCNETIQMPSFPLSNYYFDY